MLNSTQNSAIIVRNFNQTSAIFPPTVGKAILSRYYYGRGDNCKIGLCPEWLFDSLIRRTKMETISAAWISTWPSRQRKHKRQFNVARLTPFPIILTDRNIRVNPLASDLHQNWPIVGFVLPLMIEISDEGIIKSYFLI